MPGGGGTSRSVVRYHVPSWFASRASFRCPVRRPPPPRARVSHGISKSICLPRCRVPRATLSIPFNLACKCRLNIFRWLEEAPGSPRPGANLCPESRRTRISRRIDESQRKKGISSRTVPSLRPAGFNLDRSRGILQLPGVFLGFQRSRVLRRVAPGQSGC